MIEEIEIDILARSRLRERHFKTTLLVKFSENLFHYLKF